MRTVIVAIETDSDEVADEALRTMLDALPAGIKPYRAWHQRTEPAPEWVGEPSE